MLHRFSGKAGFDRFVLLPVTFLLEKIGLVGYSIKVLRGVLK
jgi:hypothetical protein